MFVYDLSDLESTRFLVVANQLFKDINFKWSRSKALIIQGVVLCILFSFQIPFTANKLPMEFRLDHENRMHNTILNIQDIFSVHE